MNIKETAVAITLMVLIIGGGLVFFSASENKRDESLITLSEGISTADHVKGATESAITLIEYSDFQCPACGSYFPIAKQLINEYGDRIRFVYRHFPLRQIHKNADSAAHAAEAASRQNKFWDMHDLLFEFQDEWANETNPTDLYINYAESLNLDIEQFTTDLENKDIKDRVNEDYLNALELGVNSTPTFFLNGKQLETPRSYDSFKQIVEEELSLLQK